MPAISASGCSCTWRRRSPICMWSKLMPTTPRFAMRLPRIVSWAEASAAAKFHNRKNRKPLRNGRRGSYSRANHKSMLGRFTMVYATSDGVAAQRLRVGMVGGGRNAFIGAVHRLAMRLDDQIALVAGALSSDPDNAAASAAEIRIAPERSYADYRAMAKAEATRPDGIEAVVIVTPNHLHAPIATAFLEAGIDVICDKPLSTTLAEAQALVALTKAKQRRFVVTLNNTGYAM